MGHSVADMTTPTPNPEDAERGIVWLEPILVNRKTAAELLGVSEDLLIAEQRIGRLKGKTTTINKRTGRSTGKALYSVAELRRWAEGLEDA